MTGSRRVQHAFTLVETILSVVIVGGMLTASLYTVGSAAVAQEQMGDHGRGQLLAHDLLVEILQQNYQEPNDTPTFGRESSETGGSRTNYDDVDDYHGWNSSPPEDKTGAEIPNLQDWRRSVTVRWVDPADGNTVSGTETGLKLIIVTVKRDSETVAIMSALRAGSRQTTGTDTLPPLGDIILKLIYGETQ